MTLVLSIVGLEGVREDYLLDDSYDLQSVQDLIARAAEARTEVHLGLENSQIVKLDFQIGASAWGQILVSEDLTPADIDYLLADEDEECP